MNSKILRESSLIKIKIFFGNHRIIRWKPNEKTGTIVAGGNGQGDRIDQFEYIKDVIIDEQNHSLIIADTVNRRVVRWINQSQQEILVENMACEGLTMDRFGFLYVSDEWKNEVRRWGKLEKKNKTKKGQ